MCRIDLYLYTKYRIMRLILSAIFSIFLFNAWAQQGPIIDVEISRLNSVLISPINGGHSGFPRIVKLPNDSLFLVYRRGLSHVDWSGKIVKQTASPNGMIWNSPQTVYDDPNTDDRGAVPMVMPDNSLFIHFYKYKLANNTVNPPVPALYSLFSFRSYNNGQTYTTPVCLDNAPLSIPAGAVWTGSKYLDSTGIPIENYAGSGAARIIDNKIVIPAYGGETPVFITSSNGYLTAPQRIVFFETSDEITWNKRFINEQDYANSWLTEPTIQLLDNNALLMHYRTSDSLLTPGGGGRMRQSVSYNSGQDFQDYTDFNFIGHAPILFKMKNGVMFSGFRWINDSLSNQKTCFVYSIDEGRNWSDTVIVAEPYYDSGYPDFVELDNNTFMIVYYDAFGTAIRGVRYKVNVAYASPVSSPYLHSGGTPMANDVFESERELEIYPNPSQGLFNLHIDQSYHEENTINIYSLQGSLIRNIQLLPSSGSFNYQLDLNELPVGIYYLELTSDHYSFRKQIVVSR